MAKILYVCTFVIMTYCFAKRVEVQQSHKSEKSHQHLAPPQNKVTSGLDVKTAERVVTGAFQRGLPWHVQHAMHGDEKKYFEGTADTYTGHHVHAHHFTPLKLIIKPVTRAVIDITRVRMELSMKRWDRADEFVRSESTAKLLGQASGDIAAQVSKTSYFVVAYYLDIVKNMLNQYKREEISRLEDPEAQKLVASVENFLRKAESLMEGVVEDHYPSRLEAIQVCEGIIGHIAIIFTQKLPEALEQWYDKDLSPPWTDGPWVVARAFDEMTNPTYGGGVGRGIRSAINSLSIADCISYLPRHLQNFDHYQHGRPARDAGGFVSRVIWDKSDEAIFGRD